ncbi:hypothetical protein vseg_015463 [Gypsophila vaccaria]
MSKVRKTTQHRSSRKNREQICQ